MKKPIAIPYDIHESEDHLLCIIPMGGVQKKSVAIKLRNYTLQIVASRNEPETIDGFVHTQKECYRGDIECHIDLPTRINEDGITSILSIENILSIKIPKKNTLENKVSIIIEE